MSEAQQQEKPSGIGDLRRIGRAELKQIGQTSAKDAGSKVESFFVAHKDAITKVGGKHISADRLLKIALGQIRATPQLAECTTASLFGAIILCATIGLEPNSYQGHVWLIPRKSSRPKKLHNGRIATDESGKWIWDEKWEVQVQIGYKGRIELAYRSPKIKLLKAVLAYENDEIEILEGTEQNIMHSPALTDRGRMIGVYAIAKLDTEETLFEWMPIGDVERIRDEFSDGYKRSADNAEAARLTLEKATGDKARKGAARDLAKAEANPWIRDFGEMARKTVINRIAKYLPQTPELDLAVAMDGEGPRPDYGMVIEAEEFGAAFVGDDAPAETSDASAETTTQTATTQAESTQAESKPAQIEHDKTAPTLTIDQVTKPAEKVAVETKPAETKPAEKVETRPAAKKADQLPLDDGYGAGFGDVE